MKRRLCAILLASGLAVSLLAAGVYAEETEMVTEADAGTEADAEDAETEEETDAKDEEESKEEDALAEMESDVEQLSEAESEAVEAESETVDVQEQMNEYMKQSIVQLLQQLSGMSDSELQTIIDEGDASSALIAANWTSVKQDLGNFVEVLDQQVETEGSILRAVSTVKYDGVGDRTTVTVTYEVDQSAQTFSVNWDVKYPMSTLMQQAALNTIMGLGIVFLTLLFLSFVISQLHIIPDMVEKVNSRGSLRKKAPAAGSTAPAAPAGSTAPAAAPAKKPAARKQEPLMDDLELVAVIAAAIAAAENTSTDGFVVRSIKKVNKSKWQKNA